MDKEKAKENRMIQQFFKNKVFWGIDSIPLKRKIYRGKISNRRKCSGQECEFVAGRSYQYERQIHTRMEQ